MNNRTPRPPRMWRIFCDFDRIIHDGPVIRQSGSLPSAGFSTQTGNGIGTRSRFEGNTSLSASRHPVPAREGGRTESRVSRGLHEFLEWMKNRPVSLTCVSEFPESEVSSYLQLHGIPAETCANPTDASGKLLPVFATPECTCCSVCIRNQIIVRSDDSDLIVLVGSSASWICAAETADLVFAEGELETLCNTRNISYTTFRRFEDIRKAADARLDRQHWHKPRRALLVRKAVWMSG